MGCCGMLVPEEWGGPGLDTISYVLMLEEVARVFTAMSTAIGVTNSAVQSPLLLFGTEAQKKKYLRRMATGETLGAFCLTEAAAGLGVVGGLWRGGLPGERVIKKEKKKPGTDTG